MRRLLTVVLLLLSLGWQAFAIAGVPPGTQPGEDAGHALLHWTEEAHHHHDDGSVTVDRSEESVEHVQLGAAPGIGLLTDSAWHTHAVVAEPPRELAPPAPPWPVLPGLRKPPRAFS